MAKVRKHDMEEHKEGQKSIRRANFVRIPPSASMVIKRGVFGSDLAKKKKSI